MITKKELHEADANLNSSTAKTKQNDLWNRDGTEVLILKDISIDK